MSQVDYADVQGLVRFGYGQHDERVVCARAREERRCGKSVDPLGSGHDCCGAEAAAEDCAATSRSRRPASKRSAFRSQSLPAFRMSFAEAWEQESRARQLGDVGNNAPIKLDWGSYGSEPHALVMFFAEQDQLRFVYPKNQGIRTGVKHSRRSLRLAPAISTGTNRLVLPMALASLQIDWDAATANAMHTIGIHQRCCAR